MLTILKLRAVWYVNQDDHKNAMNIIAPAVKPKIAVYRALVYIIEQLVRERYLSLIMIAIGRHKRLRNQHHDRNRV